MWWTNKEMRAALTSWVEHCDAQRAVRRALRFFTDRELIKALQRWREFVENKKEHEARSSSRSTRPSLNFLLLLLRAYV
jgi:hypothetical protein